MSGRTTGPGAGLAVVLPADALYPPPDPGPFAQLAAACGREHGLPHPELTDPRHERFETSWRHRLAGHAPGTGASPGIPLLAQKAKRGRTQDRKLVSWSPLKSEAILRIATIGPPSGCAGDGGGGLS